MIDQLQGEALRALQMLQIHKIIRVRFYHAGLDRLRELDIAEISIPEGVDDGDALDYRLVVL